MGPYKGRRTAKTQNAGRNLMATPPTPSSNILADARNYAKDRPVRSSRNSKPIYTIVKNANGGKKNTKRSGRPGPRLTYWLEQTISGFLSDAAFDRTKYINKKKRSDKGAVNMDILKAELLTKLNSLKRGRSQKITSEYLNTWLNHSTFTSALQELGKDQVVEGHSSSSRIAHQEPKVIDDGASTVSSELQLRVGHDSTSSSSSAALTTPLSPASEEGGQFGSMSPISIFSRENDTMSNGSTNNEGQDGFFTPGSIHSQDSIVLHSSTPATANASLKPLSKLTPAFGLRQEMNGENDSSDSSNANTAVVTNVGSEETSEQEGRDESTLALPPSGGERGTIGTAVANTVGTQDGVPPNPFGGIEAGPGSHAQGYQSLGHSPHAQIIEFYRRLQQQTNDISNLYQDMIVQHGHTHISFYVFAHLLNYWVAFVENYMNPTFW